MSNNTSGTNPLPNQIQNTQTNSQDYDASHIICNSNGTIEIKGQVVFNPPLPIDSTKISSNDQTSQIECLDGGTAQVVGNINMQSNSIENLPNPTDQQQPVTLNYLQTNYTNTINSQSFVNGAIGNLSSVYMPIDQTLNNIPLATADVDINYNKLINVSDPTDLNDAVNLEFLQANYTDTLLSQQYVNEEIALLSSVYMPIDQTLNNIPLATGDIDINNQKIINLANGVNPNDAVNVSQLNGYVPVSANINSLSPQTADYDTQGYQIVNTSLPVSSADLANKQYIDTQITNIQSNYVSNNALTNQLSYYQLIANMLNYPTFAQLSDTLSAYITSAQAYGAFQTIANMANYLTIVSAQQTYQTIANMSNYVTNSSLANTLNNYYTSTYIDSTFATISSLSNYVTNGSLSTTLADYLTISTAQSTYQTIADMLNYYTSTYIDSTFATIASLSNYVTNSSLSTTLADYLTISSAASTYQTIADMTNYYTKTASDNLFATISSLSNYVTNSSLSTTLADYLTISSAASTYQTIADMTNYYTKTAADNLFATISSLSNYVTNSSLSTTLANYVTNSSLATTLSSYLTTSTAASTYQPLVGAINTSNIATYTTEIKSTAPVKSKVSCASNSEILFDVSDVRKMRIYSPVGQATNPTGIECPDKIQFISGENSISFTGSKALVNGQQNGTGIYLQTQDSATNNVFAQFCAQPSSLSQNLTMSSGHTEFPIGSGIQTNYSTICNGLGGPQQNLQISAALPNLGDQTLNFYSNSYASTIGQTLTAQFTGKAGYSSAVSITEANQFSSKSYVDSAISALSSIYQTISAFNTAIADYYTKTQSDAKYYLNTTTLNNITAPNGNLLLGNGTTNYQIKNVLDPTSAQDVATKYYVDNIGSGISLATGKANFYTLDGTNTVLPSANLELNSFQIKNLGNPSLGTDALNLQTADSKYVLQTTVLNDLTAPTGNLSLNNQKITGLANGTNNFDAINLGQANSSYYLNTTTLNSIVAPTASLSLNSQKITNLANGTLNTDAINLSQLNTVSSNISTVSTDLNNFIGNFKTAQIVIGNYNSTTTNQNCTSFSGHVSSAVKRLSGSSPAELVEITYPNLGSAPYIYIQQSSVGTVFRPNGIVCWLANDPGASGALFYITGPTLTAGTIGTNSLGTLSLLFIYGPL